MNIVMLEDLKVSNSILDKYREKYERLGHTLNLCNEKLSTKEKLERLQDADIAIIGSEPFTSELVENSNLKFLSVGFTGVDHLDNSIYETDVKISNASGYATVSTAELTINMILNVLRNTVKLDKVTRDENTFGNLIGHELSEKVVGLVGCGKIGGHVAKILNAFGCSILIYDLYRDKDLEAIATYTTFDTLLKASDIVSIHCPLNSETSKMFNYEVFEMMKENAILINCARGAIIDDDSLLRALDNNLIQGCGIDVFDVEPPLNKNHKILQNSKITVTPHVAYATIESMEKRIRIVFDNLDGFLEGNQINVIKE